MVTGLPQSGVRHRPMVTSPGHVGIFGHDLEWCNRAVVDFTLVLESKKLEYAPTVDSSNVEGTILALLLLLMLICFDGIPWLSTKIVQIVDMLVKLLDLRRSSSLGLFFCFLGSF